jgi:predicted nucleic acid-binding protein
LIAYLDTSAVVKLVVSEPGSDDAMRIWSAARSVASSVLLYPEARAALKRAARERRLTPPQLRSATFAFERLWAQIARIGVTTALARRAGALADEQDLRGYDAVHLASAEWLRSDELVFVAADRELGAAARRLGFVIARLPG